MALPRILISKLDAKQLTPYSRALAAYAQQPDLGHFHALMRPAARRLVRRSYYLDLEPMLSTLKEVRAALRAGAPTDAERLMGAASYVERATRYIRHPDAKTQLNAQMLKLFEEAAQMATKENRPMLAQSCTNECQRIQGLLFPPSLFQSSGVPAPLPPKRAGAPLPSGPHARPKAPAAPDASLSVSGRKPKPAPPMGEPV